VNLSVGEDGVTGFAANFLYAVPECLGSLSDITISSACELLTFGSVSNHTTKTSICVLHVNQMISSACQSQPDAT